MSQHIKKVRPAHWPIGFDRDPRRGIYRVRRRGTTSSLETKDEAEALRRFALLVETVQEASRGSLFPDYARLFVDEVLEHLVAERGARKGHALAPDTVSMYRRCLTRPELHADNCVLRVPLEAIDPIRLRKYLARWLPHPKMHNHILGALSRVLLHAVREGRIARNPARDVENAMVPKRTAYLGDRDFARILGALRMDHERSAFALAYLLGCRPGEVVEVLDRHCTNGAIEYTAKKTGDRIVIETNEVLDDLVQWWRDWKRDQQLNAPTLICNPRFTVSTSRAGEPMTRAHRAAGRPIRRQYLEQVFRDAGREVGVHGFTPRDLRPKSLTDEAHARGDVETRKGGQRSESIRRSYVRRAAAVIDRNTLELHLPWIGERDANVVTLPWSGSQ